MDKESKGHWLGFESKQKEESNREQEASQTSQMQEVY